MGVIGVAGSAPATRAHRDSAAVPHGSAAGSTLAAGSAALSLLLTPQALTRVDVKTGEQAYQAHPLGIGG